MDKSKDVEDRIWAAFEDSDHCSDDDEVDYQLVHEHNRWWVREIESGKTWAVVEAAGPRAIDGFSFEEMRSDLN